MATSKEFRRAFIEEILRFSLNLDKSVKEAQGYVTDLRKLRGRWVAHGKYWEGAQWMLKIITDGLMKLEESRSLFSDSTRKAISSLAKKNERLKKRILKLEAKLLYEQSKKAKRDAGGELDSRPIDPLWVECTEGSG